MSIINKIYHKISQKENVFYAFIYHSVVWVRRDIHIPPFKVIYGPLSCVHFWTLFFFRTAKKIIFDEPIFRYRCNTVGKNFLLSFKAPVTSPNINIHIGDNCSICGYSTFSAAAINDNPTLVIGNNTTLAYQVTISVGERVEIGDNCLIADRVFIADNNGHPIDPERRRLRRKVSLEEIRPVKIGNNVWLGYQSVVLKGVTIGDNSIVGANSVVTKDVPPNSVVVGNPAVILRTIKGNAP